MKKHQKLLLLILSCVIFFSLCITDHTYASTKKETTTISISNTTVNLYTTMTTNLSVKKKIVSIKWKKAKWTSTNTKVAKVNKSGKVTAVKPGKATIKCKITWKNGKTNTVKCKVTVQKGIKLKSFNLNENQKNLSIGKTFTLKKNLSPLNSSIISTTFKSSKSSVATVNKNGKITAKKTGTTKITCTIKTFNNKTYKKTCIINVVNPVTNKNFSGNNKVGVMFTNAGVNIALDKTSIDLKVDVSSQLIAKVTPKIAGQKISSSVIFTSSNPAIATVDKTGEIVGVSKGTTNISAIAYNGATAVCKVTVSEPDPTLLCHCEPYVSTYYFDPKPDVNSDIIIPIYITNTTQSEYIEDDKTTVMDLMYEIDGNKQYIRNMKLGDNKINLGKLSAGKHYFALQTIDKETGLKSHLLNNELLVQDKALVKDSVNAHTYNISDQDLSDYNICKTNSTSATDVENTRNGLTKLFKDLADKGYEKCILPTGTYRVLGTSRLNAVSIPSHMTVDMNGSTFKLDPILEEHEGCIVIFNDVTDAHLINGTLEGDRFERKDAGLETKYLGEPINTVIFRGGSYCGIDNLVIKNTTGHTVGSQYVSGKTNYIESSTNCIIVDGKEVENPDYSTSNYIELAGLRAYSDYFHVGINGGYRGLRGKSPIIYVHYYDGEKNYLYSETAYQYRKVKIPDNAVFARVTMLGDESALKGVSLYGKHYGDFYSITNIDFYDTRTTAIAISACCNILIDNVTYTRAGNSITPSAVDFEDGWQECQDVYYRNVDCLESSGTATVIDNTGYNHVYENITNHRMVIRRGNVGCVIRNVNDYNNTTIHWTTGNIINHKYSRLEGITCSGINVSHGDEISPLVKFKVKDCTFAGVYMTSSIDSVEYVNCTIKNFNGGNCIFRKCTIYPASYLGDKLYFYDCTFENFSPESDDVTFSFNALNAERLFENCTFKGNTSMINHNNFNSGTFNNCTFDNLSLKLSLDAGENPMSLNFNNCDINSNTQNFIYLGPFAYSRGQIFVNFTNCDFHFSDGCIVYLFGKATGNSTIYFKDCNIEKTIGSYTDGNGKVNNVAETLLNLIFDGCDVSQELDKTYIDDGTKIKLSFV